MHSGSLPYVAPEVLQRGEVARPADVYSYAVLLLELWCGSAAYAGENNHGVSSTFLQLSLREHTIT